MEEMHGGGFEEGVQSFHALSEQAAVPKSPHAL